MIPLSHFLSLLSLSLSHMLTSKTRANQITPYNPTRDHTPYQEEHNKTGKNSSSGSEEESEWITTWGTLHQRRRGERANELDCLVTVRTATANVTWEQSMTCDMRRCRRGEEGKSRRSMRQQQKSSPKSSPKVVCIKKNAMWIHLIAHHRQR